MSPHPALRGRTGATRAACAIGGFCPVRIGGLVPMRALPSRVVPKLQQPNRTAPAEQMAKATTLSGKTPVFFAGFTMTRCGGRLARSEGSFGIRAIRCESSALFSCAGRERVATFQERFTSSGGQGSAPPAIAGPTVRTGHDIIWGGKAPFGPATCSALRLNRAPMHASQQVARPCGRWPAYLCRLSGACPEGFYRRRNCGQHRLGRSGGIRA